MFDLGLLVSFAAIFVAALAGVLGVWMERDPDRKKYFAVFFSIVILMAGVVESGHAIIAAWNDASTEDAMAEVLEQLTELSEKSGNPELSNFVGAELSRSNPKIVKRVQKKVAARGGDPEAVKRRAAEGRSGAGKAGKSVGDAEGKTGKAADGTEGGAEGKTGKAADGTEGGAEGKTGKAADGTEGGAEGGAEGKTGKADGAPTGAEGKTGKADGAPAGAEGKAGGKAKAP